MIDYFSDKVRIKKGEKIYYCNGCRLTLGEIRSPEFVRAFARLNSWAKRMTNGGKDEKGFLKNEFKSFFTKEYKRGLYFAVDKDFSKILSYQKRFELREIWQYDIANCYPSIFRCICRDSVELYEMFNELPKPMRLKVLGALGSKTGIVMKKNNSNNWEVECESEFYNKYFYIYTTIYSFLNKIILDFIKNYGNLYLLNYCDAVFVRTDLGSDEVHFEYNSLPIVFKVKGRADLTAIDTGRIKKISWGGKNYMTNSFTSEIERKKIAI